MVPEKIKVSGQVFKLATGMSKGIVVLDENIEFLEKALRDRNIRVVMVPNN